MNWVLDKIRDTTIMRDLLWYGIWQTVRNRIYDDVYEEIYINVASNELHDVIWRAIRQ